MGERIKNSTAEVAGGQYGNGANQEKGWLGDNVPPFLGDSEARRREFSELNQLKQEQQARERMMQLRKQAEQSFDSVREDESEVDKQSGENGSALTSREQLEVNSELEERPRAERLKFLTSEATTNVEDDKQKVVLNEALRLGLQDEITKIQDKLDGLMAETGKKGMIDNFISNRDKKQYRDNLAKMRQFERAFYEVDTMPTKHRDFSEDVKEGIEHLSSQLTEQENEQIRQMVNEALIGAKNQDLKDFDEKARVLAKSMQEKVGGKALGHRTFFNKAFAITHHIEPMTFERAVQDAIGMKRREFTAGFLSVAGADNQPEGVMLNQGILNKKDAKNLAADDLWSKNRAVQDVANNADKIVAAQTAERRDVDATSLIMNVRAALRDADPAISVVKLEQYLDKLEKKYSKQMVRNQKVIDRHPVGFVEKKLQERQNNN